MNIKSKYQISLKREKKEGERVRERERQYECKYLTIHRK